MADKKAEVKKAYEAVVNQYKSTNSKTDPDGSYTGYYRKGETKSGNAPEVPVQDADDK